MVKFGSKTTALEVINGKDLSGLNSIVTGGNSGIGVETVRALATAGSDVILCSRNADAGEKVAQEIRSGGVKGTIKVKALDLADFDSIKSFADEVNKELSHIDLLILNAGVMACPLERTKQGFELQIGTNHIGGFYLTKLLLPKLKASSSEKHKSRVVAVSSTAHRLGAINIKDLNYEKRWYNAWQSYAQSKLANVLFAKELAKREGDSVLAYSLHPGVINTNLQRHMGVMQAPFSLFNFMMKSIPQGASTTVVAATADNLPNGCYLSDCQEKKPSQRARDEKMASALWEKTEELVNAALKG